MEEPMMMGSAALLRSWSAVLRVQEEVDFDHPLLSAIFEEGSDELKSRDERRLSPVILKSINLRAGKGGRSLITLSNGTTFFSEHSSGEGKILMFSTAPTLRTVGTPVANRMILNGEPAS